MVELARGAELADVTLSGLFCDVERGSNLDVFGTVEAVRQRGEEARTRCLGELTRAFGGDGRCRAFVRMPGQGLEDFGGVLQQHLDDGHGRLEVDVGADDALRLFDLSQWGAFPAPRGDGKSIHEAKDGDDHRNAEKDKTEATDRGHDVVAEGVGIVALRLSKEVVETPLLIVAERELHLDGGKVLQEGVEVLSNLTETLIGGGTIRHGEHIAPDEFGLHDVEDETAEEAVFSIRNEVEDLLQGA